MTIIFFLFTAHLLVYDRNRFCFSHFQPAFPHLFASNLRRICYAVHIQGASGRTKRARKKLPDQSFSLTGSQKSPIRRRMVKASCAYEAFAMLLFSVGRSFHQPMGIRPSFHTNSQLKCLTERIRFFVLTKPSEVRRTGGTLNGTRQSQSEKDGARIKPF